MFTVTMCYCPSYRSGLLLLWNHGCFMPWSAIIQFLLWRVSFIGTQRKPLPGQRNCNCLSFIILLIWKLIISSQENIMMYLPHKLIRVFPNDRPPAELTASFNFLAGSKAHIKNYLLWFWRKGFVFKLSWMKSN